MVSIYLALPVLALLAVLQTSVVPRLTLWGVFPDLPLLAVVSWSLLGGARAGAGWGLAAGLALDILSGAPLGAATLGLGAAGFLAGLGEAGLSRAGALPLGAAFLATLIYDLTFLAFRQVVGHHVAWLEALWRIILPSAVLNSALILPVLWLSRQILWATRRGEIDL
jgi:rod shape-determining protein MreD